MSEPLPAHAAAARVPRLEGGALVLGELRVPLLSGAMHYFRSGPARWRRALESIRDMGLPLVETYVPWGVHELSEGRYDFGEHERHRDLGAFLDLAHELGLFVFLRPGPNVNAELAYFGLPRRVVLDQRNQARSPSGRPLPLIAPPRMFAVPSYASRHFRREVGRWFAAVGEVVAPRRWPNGPVVLVQVDNEAAFYFRDAPYDQDYHPDALTDYARFLSERFGDIARLNRVYGLDARSFEEVSPPTRMDATCASELPRHLDWMRFHERLIGEALSAMAEQLAEAGLGGLPLCHNLAMGEGGLPATVAGLSERIELVGLDYYHTREGISELRRRTLRLAGSSPLPFAPELGVGAPPWFSPRSDDDSLMAALCACAYGLRGFNLYMVVDRDRWYGAPLDADGTPRPAAARFAKLIKALREVEFHRLRRVATVALSIPKEYSHLVRATHSLGALSPSLLDLMGIGPDAACLDRDFGFAQPIQHAAGALISRVAAALSAAGVPFVFADSDRDLRELPGLRAVFAPSFELADPARFERLHRFAQAGGRVLFGPLLPSMDLDLQPARLQPPDPRGPIELATRAEADELVRGLLTELSPARGFLASPHPLEATVHEDETGPRVVFVINPSSEHAVAELQAPFACKLRDVLSDETFEVERALALPVEARSGRMLICERRESSSARPRPPSARAGRPA